MDQESHGPATKFESAFMEKCGVDVVDSRNHSMEEIWSHLKSSLNSAAVKASGYSNKRQWKSKIGGGTTQLIMLSSRSVGAN